MARIVALLVVAVIAAVPAAAPAAAVPTDPTQAPLQQQQAPSSPQNRIGEQPTQTQAPPQTDTSSISGWEGLLIGAGIVGLIGAIWLVIARDAKRATSGRLPGAESPLGRSATRASRRSRRLSAAERRRRKRGRAAK